MEKEKEKEKKIDLETALSSQRRAFDDIENAVINQIMSNLHKHVPARDTEEAWQEWRLEQGRHLQNFAKALPNVLQPNFKKLNNAVIAILAESYEQGKSEVQKEIENANRLRTRKLIKAPYKPNPVESNAIDTQQVIADLERAEQQFIARAVRDYSKIIATTYGLRALAKSGAPKVADTGLINELVLESVNETTFSIDYVYGKAVDAAAKPMLMQGIQCVQYSNGSLHTLPSFADVKTRTASKESYLKGEAAIRDEFGIHTVIINRRGPGCPCYQCIPFVGKILIDDVFSSYKPDGTEKYPLLSYAMQCGLYHPNCRDIHTTYFPGITTADGRWKKADIKAMRDVYDSEQKTQQANVMWGRYHRLAKHCKDPDNARKYEAIAQSWRKKIK